MAAEGLTQVRARMTVAATRAGRRVDDICLVAVSKGRAVDEILAVYRDGQRDFGENRAQEMVAKAAELPDDIRWHFVGPLQRRKVKLIRPITYLLQSLDRVALAAAWSAGAPPPPPTLLEINIGAESQKHGVLPEDVAGTLAALADCGVLPRGLMAIPPVPDHATESRPWFAQLHHLQQELRADHPNLVELSMGMTDDFEVAIEEGASMVRVGRAIFEPAE